MKWLRYVEQSKQILALVSDLMFAVRLADVVRALGHEPLLVETADGLAAGIAANPNLVILDLALVDHWESLVRRIKDDPSTAVIPMLAFGSHMDVATQQRGRAAGVDRVVANSKFAADLPLLIAQLAR